LKVNKIAILILLAHYILENPNYLVFLWRQLTKCLKDAIEVKINPSGVF